KPQDQWVSERMDQGFAAYTGEASFLDAQHVRVGDLVLEAERILIATGSRTAVPPVEGIDDVEWIDHISALELTEVPESLLVVGAGPVGLEFAQIFARFGSRVTVVNHGAQIAARADADAASELQAALEDEGIEIVLDATLEHVSRDEAVVGGRTLKVSHVLLSSGRVPNVEELRLDAIGVELSRGGIVVDGRQRTSVPGVWAVGDVAVGPWFTPTAQYQARLAIEDMFAGNGTRTADYSALPTAIFTDPELGAVGLTEEEARTQGYETGV